MNAIKCDFLIFIHFFRSESNLSRIYNLLQLALDIIDIMLPSDRISNRFHVIYVHSNFFIRTCRLYHACELPAMISNKVPITIRKCYSVCK